MFPLPSLLKGTFPQDTQAGRICLLRNGPPDTFVDVKAAKIHFVYLLIDSLVALYSKWRVDRFLAGHCPRKKMSCIGKYQRNVLSLQETTRWLYLWAFHALVNLVTFISIGYFKEYLSMSQTFWIWNLKGFIFNEGLHFVIPLFLKLPEKGVSPIKFFITHQVKLQPRRPYQKFSERFSEEKGSESRKYKKCHLEEAMEEEATNEFLPDLIVEEVLTNDEDNIFESVSS